MRILALLFVLAATITLTGCAGCGANGTPVVLGESNKRVAADCDLVLLFEVDGAKVYRFRDESAANYKYLAVGKDGSVSITRH